MTSRSEKCYKSNEKWKATGLDKVIAPKLLKTDLDERTKKMAKLFNKMKEEGIAPKSWNRGLIAKLSKTGDLRECTNWGVLHCYQSPVRPLEEC